MQRLGAGLERIVNELWLRRLCAYCGMYAEEREHVVPRKTGYAKIVVPACHECNTLAGSECFPTFAEKRDFIHSRLKKRYRHAINAPEWDSLELGELDYVLRAMCETVEVARRVVEQRLSFVLEGFDGWASPFDGQSAQPP